jgi:hypothetical protein
LSRRYALLRLFHSRILSEPGNDFGAATSGSANFASLGDKALECFSSARYLHEWAEPATRARCAAREMGVNENRKELEVGNRKGVFTDGRGAYSNRDFASPDCIGLRKCSGFGF